MVFASKIQKSKYDFLINPIIFNLIIITTIIFFIYINRVDEIPLFAMFKNLGESSKLWLLREDHLNY